MSTVRLATFSVVSSSAVSLSVSSKLPKRRSSPVQFKLIVKYDSTTDSENSYGGKIRGELQSETSFKINFQVKLSKENNYLDGLFCLEVAF